MDLIYLSDHFCILAYRGQHGLELLDKETLRSLYLSGVAARNFCLEMERLSPDDRDIDTIDAFLDDYCREAASPIVFH